MLVYPGAHLQSLEEMVPNSEIIVFGQGLQEKFPMMSLYVFLSHATHCSLIGVYPSLQTQAMAPVFDVALIEHVMQSSFPGNALYLPASHDLQNPSME